MEIPVGRLHEVYRNERPHLGRLVSTASVVYSIGEIRWIVTAQSHAHEVVEALSLERKFQGILVDDEVFNFSIS